MKLLYLYIDNWPDRGITSENPIELNFETGFRFHYGNGILKVTLSQCLPVGFFTSCAKGEIKRNTTKDNASLVESVSVIIGDNGSGKTSIASVLGKLFRRGRPLPSYLCIYQRNRDLLLYQSPNKYGIVDYRLVRSALINVGYRWINVDDDQNLPNAYKYLSDIKFYERPFDVIYYSPYLPMRDLWDDENRCGFQDVSTGHYILGRALDNEKRIDNELPLDKAAKLYLWDQLLLYNYAHEYVNLLGKSSNDQELILPLPKYAQIVMPFHDYISRLREWVLSERNLDVDKARIMKSRLVEESCFKLEVAMNSEAALRFVTCVLIEAILRAPPRHISDSFAQGIDVLWQTLEQVKQVLSVGEYHSPIKIDSVIVGLGLNQKVLVSLIDRLIKISMSSKISNKSAILHVDIKSKEGLDDILDIIRLSSRLGRGYDTILKTRLSSMSSGEMAYWTLFSRLYDVLDGYRLRSYSRGGSKKDILVFLDESETTLHPDWQREIVRNVIQFFEKFTRNLRIHIVFATHSPMILSDVPRGNVVCLGGAGDDGQPESFGANIFDLYRYGFVLKDGTVGSFAQKKIDDLVEKVFSLVRNRGKSDKRGSITGADRQLVDLIADKNVARYLREWLKELDRGKDLIR